MKKKIYADREMLKVYNYRKCCHLSATLIKAVFGLHFHKDI